jgi:hypothetical protein
MRKIVARVFVGTRRRLEDAVQRQMLDSDDPSHFSLRSMP